MKIALVLPSITESYLKLARQISADGVVTGLPPRGDDPLHGFGEIVALRKRIEDAGLRLMVIESMAIPDRVKLGLPGRDEDIERWRAGLRNLGAAGVPIVCYNWMAVFGWLRTSFTTRVRGDALATSYDHDIVARGPLSEYGEVAEERLWDSLHYFLQAVVPAAEEANVLLAIHPDDPPLSPIRGIGRILTSPEALQRVVDLVPSRVNGITFCQGCFAEMGADLPAEIRRFAGQEKLFFAHFRNLKGDRYHFTEMFHDDGETDMYAAMKAYLEAGFEGPMRPDHVPTLEGDDNARPGYSLLGRLFAVGYMRGLIEAIEKGR